ncbi:reverse transcriptase domain-containing protein [Tanacetum coccineum]|uniref:Reverse transcriptase domain-containing protein n=1 Tax=Tanacetum coccineum TaxID=301880 RepID=A0ABQ4WCP1_9ASTR
MQRLLRAKFLPLTFKQDAYLDYQNLRQGSLSVEDLITEFERMRLRCGAEEDEEQVIARFLGVLRPDIADAVSLTQYYSFSDVCRLALRVEQQNTRKNKSVGRFQPSTRTSTQPQFAPKPGPTKTETPTVTTAPLDTSGPLRCFKCQGLGHLKRDCPNKQLVAFVDDVEPKYDTENEDASVTLYPDQGEALIVRRVLTSVVTPPDNDTTWLRHNIFRTQCTSKGRVCTVIIDGGSCENMVAKTMVDKLGLPTTDHPDPYQLTWFRKVCSNGTRCHLLLGRPWLYDHQVKHDGFRNTYSFHKDGLHVTLAPLNPKDATPSRPMTKDEIVGLARQSPPGPILGLVVLEENTPISDVPHEDFSFVIRHKAGSANTVAIPYVEGEAQATQIKALHEQVRDQITKHNLQYQARANKHRKHVVFNEGDLVWIYLRRPFSAGSLWKVQDRADGPFRVLKRINDNAYKIDLPGSYGVSATFNVADLTPYVEADDFHGDSGTSRFLEGEDDTDGPDGSSPVDQRAVDENEAGGLSG